MVEENGENSDSSSVSTSLKNYAEIYDGNGGVDSESEWTLGETSKYLTSILDKMVWTHGEIVMDFGCGTGRHCLTYFASRAKQTGSKIYGVDISEDMIQIARTKYMHPNVEYVHGDILNLDLPLNKLRYNKIFVIYVLRNVQRKIETIQKLYELLEPGGQLLIVNAIVSPFIGLSAYLKQSSKWGPLLQNGLSNGYWYPDPPSSSSSKSGTTDKEHAYHITRYNELLTSTGFLIHENFVFSSHRAYSSVIECAECVIACNPHAFGPCLKTRDDQQSLEDTICKYFINYCGANATDDGKGEEYKEIVWSICVRAEKRSA